MVDINKQNFKYHAGPTRSLDFGPYPCYASAEVTVSGGSTNFSFAKNTALFEKITVSNEVLVRGYGGSIGLRFNDPTNDVITLDADDQIGFSNLEISDIYVTASGSARVRVTVCGWR